MFEVKDAWNVTVKSFEDRESAMEYIRQRGPEQLHLSEGE